MQGALSNGLIPLQRGQTLFPRTWTSVLCILLFLTGCNSPSDSGESALQVTIAGLLGGAPAAVRVTGPGGYDQTLTTSQTLPDLTAGGYTVTAQTVTAGSQTWRPVGGPVVVQVGSGTAKTLVTYRLAAELVVVINGLPAGTTANVDISGFTGVLLGGTNHILVDPGSHTIALRPVSAGGGIWNPVTAAQSIAATGGGSSTVTLVYAPVNGQLQVTVTGLPGGGLPAGSLTGPDGFSAPISSVGINTFAALPPGVYTVAFNTVVINGSGWSASPVTQLVSVSSNQLSQAAASYAASTGALDLTITGLVDGAVGNVTVVGPGGPYHFTGSTVLALLPPGTYTITASGVPSGTTTLNPSPAQQSVQVTAGAKSTASITYLPAASLVISVSAVYINQAAQNLAFTVPLVTGRQGLLRVFLRANEANTARPDVRIRLYNGAVLAQTFMVPAPGSSTPLVVTEGDLATSWNLEIPDGMLQPGMRLLVDVDPTLQIPLATRSTLTWPASGTAQALNIRSGPAYNLTFVPVTQTSTGTTGDVNATNVEDFLLALRRLHPVTTASVAIHAPVSFTGGAMNTADASPWIDLLGQIEQVRVLEGTSRYYFGVVNVPSPTWSGFGYVPPEPSLNVTRSAVGWDSRPGGVFGGVSLTFAHELGHNLGLQHAPCGGAASPDPSYPHSGGKIGAFGWDIVDKVVRDPAMFDLMTYCSPPWVSDYFFTQMFRATPPALIAGSVAVPRRVMIVSGSIQSGRLTLNPLVETFSQPSLSNTDAPYRVEGRLTDGTVAFIMPFTPARIADAPGDIRHFTLAVPIAAGVSLSQLRVIGPGLDAAVNAPAASAGAATSTPPQVTATRLAGGRVQLRWDAVRYPLLVVRDAANSEVLGIARGGLTTVTTRGGALTLLLSQGLRSETITITP